MEKKLYFERIEDALADYTDRPYRLQSNNVDRLRNTIGRAGEIIAIFASHFRTMAKARHDIDVAFAFSSAAGSNKPATADLVDGIYRIKIEVSFIHLFYREIEKIQEIDARNYDPAALAILASVSAAAHEFTHAIFGHFEKPPTVLVGGVVFEEEFEADRGGGIGCVSILVEPIARKLLADHTGLIALSDVLEAGFLSQWLLATVIALFPTPTLNYPHYETRALAYTLGFASTAVLAKAARPSDIANSFIYALHIARKIQDSLFSKQIFTDIVAALNDSEQNLGATQIDKIVTRRAETMTASPFKCSDETT